MNKLHGVLGASLLMCACLLGKPAGALAGESVSVYNWGNSVGHDTVANFQHETSIKVHYDEFDSNDTLQAKLLAGSSGYDVVVPSDAYWAKQVQAGVYQKLDKSKIPNFAHLDPALMKLLDRDDPGHDYGIPWSWGTDGIGMNLQRVRAALGADAPLDSLALLFDPKYAAKLQKCGISLIDAPMDVFGMALIYLKKNPFSTNPADYRAAYALLKSVRSYIGQFNSGSYIGDLANGDICIALGWSGDVNTSRVTALDAKRAYEIRYVIPKEGSVVWFDMMAVPKDAPNPDAALKFINFVLSDRESANLTNDTYYPSAIPGARPMIRADVLKESTVYPGPEQLRTLTPIVPLPVEIMRLETHLWQQLKTDD
ncbi:extracellular solute-binding protein [Trinickia terrae]|uniref:Putrescine-binding periplasmic protein n=1 Tax=Trinickia terrae TaxID=2571161 RepID=A0A4U1I3U8_9BURK|nr:extracellular solute-binding protein [Trinickia terrae]TKC87933.1 extracellular solute-binding protein [Trinickia terrae]